MAKLPLWDTICLAYSTFFHNLRDVFLISWLWLIVVVPLMATVHTMQWSWMAGALAELRQRGASRGAPVSLSIPLELRVLIYAVGLLFMAAGVSIAVAWHRRIILGEQPRLSGSNVATGNFWRYLGIGIAIVLIAILPAILSLLVVFSIFLSPFVSIGAPRPITGVAALVMLIPLLLYLVGIAVILRLCLLLPARAVGDLSVTFRQAWNGTHGNTWRLFWGILACVVPPGLIIQIAFLILVVFLNLKILAGGGSSPGLVFAMSAIAMACYLLVLPLWIGFLSLSYLHFFQPAHRAAVFD